MIRRKAPARKRESSRHDWVSEMHAKIGLPKDTLSEVYSHYIEKARKKRTA